MRVEHRASRMSAPFEKAIFCGVDAVANERDKEMDASVKREEDEK
jgi:hypothetical protein